MTPAPRSTLTTGMWLAAGLLMLAEFLLFDRMTSLHHTAIYPRWNDQIQYLTEAYRAYEQVPAHGLGAGLKFALGKDAVQGTLHDTAAVVVFWLAGGPSRSAALSLNLLVFLAWQAALLFAIPRVSGSRSLAWAGFGLLLCVAWPWSGEAASAVDFRLDHGAMCLLGVTSCVALLTAGFRSRGWSVALGAAIGVTLLERFLTGVYFAAIFPACVAWILCGPERGRRLRNLALAGLTATAMALPVFWINRTAIYTYYWVGHVTGAESVARFRGLDLWHSVQFIFGHLGDMHLGAWFGWTAAGLTAVLAVLRQTGSRPAASGAAKPDRDWLFLALSFLLLPAFILCLHKQKSEYVLGVLVPGVILLVLWLWRRLWPGAAEAPVWRRHAGAVLAGAVLAAGGTYFVSRQLVQPHTEDFLASTRQINQVADHIFTAAQGGHVTNPYIAVDQVVDYLDATILKVICYERHKTWVPFVIQLPDSILADKDEAMFYRLKLCDFVVLTDEMAGNGHWPYDQQMRRLYPQFKVWCDENLKQVETFSAFGRKMSLYQRRTIP